METTITDCPVQAAIAQRIEGFKARRSALVRFRDALKPYEGKSENAACFGPEVQAAADALCSLPQGFADPIAYRFNVPGGRVARISTCECEREVALCERRIHELDDAATYDYSGAIAAKRAWDTEYAKLGPFAKAAWLIVASRIK